MNCFCFSFALNQKYWLANLLRLIAAKSVPKYALSKTGSKITIATQKNEKTTQLWRKGISMQYHSINIEKLQKRMKNKFSNIAYHIRTLEGYTSHFWKTFFGQSILTLNKAFKVAVFTVMLLLRRNTSLLPIRPWIA